MAVDNPGVIDIVSIDPRGYVVLTISDHLEWDGEHLLILQDKINAYLAAIEDGSLAEEYPDISNRMIAIRVTCKYPPDAEGRRFLDMVREYLERSGYEFTYKVINDN